MHFLTLLLSATVAFAAPAPLAAPEAEPDTLSARAPCNTQRCQVDNLLFSSSLGDFLKAKSARSPAGLIWYDDGCSNAPDKPRGYNFLDSCYRHDFGYKNYKAQSRFNEDNRGKIDQKFKDDLYAMCSQYSGLKSWKGVECRRIADAYYAAVRNFGNKEVRIPDVDIPGI